MLNKYEVKELALIRIIAEKGRYSDARRAAAEWVRRAGDRQGTAHARNEALASLWREFDTYPKGQASNGS